MKVPSLPSSLGKKPGQKLLALALAVALWWYVAGESKVQVGHVVPLEIRNIPAGTIVTNKVERQVEVRLSAPPTLLSNLNPSQVSVSLDLGSLPEGKHAIPLTERDVSVPRGVAVARIFPAVVEIQIEKVVRKALPIVPVIHYPPSDPRRPSRVEIDPPEGIVEGTPAELSRIRAIETEELFPDRAPGNWDVEAALNPPGEHAKILKPRTVHVKVVYREKERR